MKGTKFELSTYILKKTGKVSKSWNQYLFDQKSMDEVKLIIEMEKNYTKKQLLEIITKYK